MAQAVDGEAQAYLKKAVASLAGATSEQASGRYDNAANRLYYSCFQAAIAALLQAGIRPRNPRMQWGHDVVQAQFVEQLILRRKLYPANLANVLSRSLELRQAADYRPAVVSETRTARALRQAQTVVATVESLSFR